MKKNFQITLLLIALLVMPLQLFAWGTIGHRTIAEIAQENLNSRAKKAINKLLADQSMAYWSNWPDFIKSDTTDTWKHTSSWHYINAPSNLSKEEFVQYIKNIKEENLYSEVSRIIGELKSSQVADEQKRIDLYFLIHLLGDLAQPFHVGRGEDLGGNRIKLSYFQSKTNLHALWDSKLVDAQRYSYTEYAKILNVMSKEQRNEYSQGELEDWVYDSHLIAENLYAITPNGAALSYNYNYQVDAILEAQLRKGGLRLAKILNEIFKK